MTSAAFLEELTDFCDVTIDDVEEVEREELIEEASRKLKDLQEERIREVRKLSNEELFAGIDSILEGGESIFNREGDFTAERFATAVSDDSGDLDEFAIIGLQALALGVEAQVMMDEVERRRFTAEKRLRSLERRAKLAAFVARLRLAFARRRARQRPSRSARQLPGGHQKKPRRRSVLRQAWRNPSGMASFADAPSVLSKTDPVKPLGDAGFIIGLSVVELLFDL